MSFGIAISDVVGLSTEEEVFGTDAVLDIAAVTDHQPRWDVSIEVFPDHTVRSSLFRPVAKRCVAIAETRCCPEPARLSLTDFAPEPCGEGHSMMLSLLSNSSRAA
jgi:hypothetical protein